MIIAVSTFLFIASVLVIVYPLYFQKMVSYVPSDAGMSDFNEQDALLSALTDLEEEFQMGRMSEADYDRLKLHFQRHYLQAKQS